MSTKQSYKNAVRKKAVREFLFSFFDEKNIVGLAGPDIQEYLEWCKQKGMVNIELWENDPNVMFNQLMKLPKNSKVSYNFGDIINANSSPDTLYDLDYCCTVNTIRNDIKKFKNEKFVMTFSIRAVGEDATINQFFRGRREKIKNVEEKSTPFRHRIFKTVFGTYIAAPYFDTTPMISIAKIS